MIRKKLGSLLLASAFLLLSLLVGCSKSDSTTPTTTPQAQNNQQNEPTEKSENTQQANNSEQNSNNQQIPTTPQAPDREVTTDIPQIPNTQQPSANQPNTKNIVPNTDYIEAIRQGTLYDYPWVTVGDAFDYYFGETNWYEFYDDYNNHIIEVEGIGYEYEEYVLINVQFILYPNGEFESWGLWVNGELRSDYDLQAFIEAVFNP